MMGFDFPIFCFFFTWDISTHSVKSSLEIFTSRMMLCLFCVRFVVVGSFFGDLIAKFLLVLSLSVNDDETESFVESSSKLLASEFDQPYLIDAYFFTCHFQPAERSLSQTVSQESSGSIVSPFSDGALSLSTTKY